MRDWYFRVKFNLIQAKKNRICMKMTYIWVNYANRLSLNLFDLTIQCNFLVFLRKIN